MFGRRKDDEDPFAALKDGGTYKSEPTTIAGLGSTELAPDPLNPLTAPADSGPPPGLGATATPTAPQAPRPAPSPSANQQMLSAAANQQMNAALAYSASRRGRRSSFGGLSVAIRLAVFAIVLGAIAIPIVSAVNHVHSVSVPSFNFGSASNPSTTANPSSPTTHKQITYLTSAGVAAGIAHLKKVAPGAKVKLLRIDAKSFNAIVVRPGHSTKEY